MADKIDQIPFKIICPDTSEHSIQIDPTLVNGIPGPVIVRGEVTTGTVTFSVGKAIGSQSAAFAAASNKSFQFTLPYGVTTFNYKGNATNDAFVGYV